MRMNSSLLTNSEAPNLKKETVPIPKQKSLNLTPAPKLVPPDGGWGWVIALGGCINHMLSTSLIPSFSLLFSSFFVEHNLSSTMVAWIFNVNQCVWNVSSFVAGPLCSKFGWRTVSFFGGIALSLSVILSGFVRHPVHLFITFSILTGIGQGICVVITLVIVAHYFDKRKGLATGIVSIGNPLGLFLGPLVVNYLLEQFGRCGACLLLGGIMLHSCVISLLFHPVEWHSIKATDKVESQTFVSSVSPKSMIEGSLVEPHHLSDVSSDPKKVPMDPERAIQPLLSCNDDPVSENVSTTPTTQNSIARLVMRNLTQLKFHRVHVISATIGLTMSAYTNFLMLVPFSLSQEGQSLEMVSWFLSISGFSNLIARVVVTALTDVVSFSSRYFFMIGSLGLFVSMLMFSLVSSPLLVMLTMCLFGMSVGACLSLISIVILEFMGLKRLPAVVGLIGILVAIIFLITGPVVGVIRDATQSYVLTTRILSVAPLLSFVLWFLMPCAVTLDRKQDTTLKENQEEG